MSTVPAIAAATAVPSKQVLTGRLEPFSDIPPERRAKLADELADDAKAESSGRGGRRDRRPQRTTRDDSYLSSSASGLPGFEAALGFSDDAEVKAVFDKLVGNLTKEGKKMTARRIVLDAMRAMHGHLRRGDLDNIK